MATITKHTNDTPAVSGLHSTVICASNQLDFSLTGNNVAAADVVQAVKIPAGAYVVNVAVIVDTAEGSACTATVGDADGASSWDASTNLNASANTETAGLAGTDAYATAGKYYPTEDTIDLTMDNAASTAKITVMAFYLLRAV